MKNYPELQENLTLQISRTRNEFATKQANLNMTYSIRFMKLSEEKRQEQMRLSEEYDRKVADLVKQQQMLRDEQKEVNRKRWNELMDERRSVMEEMRANGINPRTV